MNHTIRTADLKRMLTDKRQELALAKVSPQTVARIDDALARLDEGKYGSCLECAREISERRLQASPFALRCQACEERREQDGGRRHASVRAEEPQHVALPGGAQSLSSETCETEVRR